MSFEDADGGTNAFATHQLRRGPVDVAALRQLPGRPYAAVLTGGLLVRELLLGPVPAAELVGPGDALVLDREADELLDLQQRWTAVKTTRLVLLDQASRDRLAEHPKVVLWMLERQLRQTERAAAHRAIVQLPNVEQRILALLHHLAERWGKVTADGLVVPLRMTHEMLGALAGARRPTVTLALKALETSGEVTRLADGWRLEPLAGGLHFRSTRQPV